MLSNQVGYQCVIKVVVFISVHQTANEAHVQRDVGHLVKSRSGDKR